MHNPVIFQADPPAFLDNEEIQQQQQGQLLFQLMKQHSLESSKRK